MALRVMHQMIRVIAVVDAERIEEHMPHFMCKHLPQRLAQQPRHRQDDVSGDRRTACVARRVVHEIEVDECRSLDSDVRGFDQRSLSRRQARFRQMQRSAGQ